MVAKTKHTAGLLHVVLPESAIDPGLARKKPGYFADTGILVLLREMNSYGCSGSSLVVKLVGGAASIEPDMSSDIGKRNLRAVMEELRRQDLSVVAMDVGV
jgi:chemotaxis protein CheD